MSRLGDRFGGVMSPLEGSSGEASTCCGEGIVTRPFDFLCMLLLESWLDRVGGCDKVEVRLALLDGVLLRNLSIVCRRPEIKNVHQGCVLQK